MQGANCQTGSSHLNCLYRNFKYLKLYYSNCISNISGPKNSLLSRLKWLYQFQVLFTHFILSWTVMVYYVLEEDYPSLACLIVNVIQSFCTRRHILVNLLCIIFTSTIPCRSYTSDGLTCTVLLHDWSSTTCQKHISQLCCLPEDIC